MLVLPLAFVHSSSPPEFLTLDMGDYCMVYLYSISQGTQTPISLCSEWTFFSRYKLILLRTFGHVLVATEMTVNKTVNDLIICGRNISTKPNHAGWHNTVNDRDFMVIDRHLEHSRWLHLRVSVWIILFRVCGFKMGGKSIHAVPRA